jgi:hypothetical protein
LPTSSGRHEHIRATNNNQGNYLMSRFTGLIFILLYLSAIVGVGVYLIVLLARFVKAHQRGAEALEAIARKLPAVRNE